MTKKQASINDSKLLKLLKSCSKRELTRFRKYLNAPFFNSRREAIQLFDLLLKAHPDFEKPITKAEIISVIYSVDKKENNLNQLMAYLVKHIEDFLVYEVQKNSLNDNYILDKNYMLSYIFMEAQLYEYIHPLLDKSNKKLEATPYRNRYYYYHRYLLAESHLYMNVIKNNRAKEVGLQHVIDTFWHFCLSNILMYYCAALDRSLTVKRAPYDFFLLENIIEAIGKNKANFPPIILIYYHVILFLTIEEKEAKKESFEALQRLMLENKSSFAPMDLRSLYTFMINFCGYKIRTGALEYREKLLTFYKDSLPTGIWESGIYFSAHHYIQMARGAASIGLLDKNFIEEYKAKLDPKYLPDIYQLALAYYFFQEKNWNQVQLALITFVEKEDFVYDLNVRLLFVKTYYEQEEVDLLEKTVEAFRIYLQRQKDKEMSEEIYSAAYCFIRLVIRLIGLPNKLSKRKTALDWLLRLKKDIQEAPLLVERAWLLEKVAFFEEKMRK